MGTRLYSLDWNLENSVDCLISLVTCTLTLICSPYIALKDFSSFMYPVNLLSLYWVTKFVFKIFHLTNQDH